MRVVPIVWLSLAFGARLPLLVLPSDDGGAANSDSLVSLVRARGNRRVAAAHAHTDHSWNDRRIELQARVINWLDELLTAR